MSWSEQKKDDTSMTYQELQAALKVFGLDERASLKEIKKRHRALVKIHHPDQVRRDSRDGEQNDPEQIRQINEAYALILDYLESYRFSFCEEEFYRQNPDQQLHRQFGNDPLWGI